MQVFIYRSRRRNETYLYLAERDDFDRVPEDQIAEIKVLETIKEGKSIYRRPAGDVALATPALFGITRHDHQQVASPVRSAQGDGCFNPALSVLVNALNTSPQ